MSFLSDLKNQATALQHQQLGAEQGFSAGAQACDLACRMAEKYLQDLCTQLNVIRPPAAGVYSLDGKLRLPALVLENFRCDARKKTLRNAEVTDYIGVGWDLMPAAGGVQTQCVTVNFPPELERVRERLSMGQVRHERKDERHPESQQLLAYVFEYQAQARGFITLTAEHDAGQIAFRVSNVGGFEVLNTRYPAAQVTPALMDELAKKLLGQPSRFG